MQPLVSVIIPTRDRPGFLQEAIESVSRQTCKNYEIIVVVNGPDNHLIAEAVKIAAAGGCSVLRIDRSGIAVALNTGIQAAKGEWLAFLDDDDVWEPANWRASLRSPQTHGRMWCSPTSRTLTKPTVFPATCHDRRSRCRRGKQ
jgi:glycosyltransferase involved in cell wall biosynthesis